MPPHISLHELYVMQKEKKTARTVSFDKILEQCHRRIRTIAAHGGMNTFFEIPGMLVGYPLYNIFECCQYVVEQLRKTGFLVQILPPPHVCVIYMSWDPQELKPNNTKASPSQRRPPALPAPSQGPQPPRLRLF